MIKDLFYNVGNTYSEDGEQLSENKISVNKLMDLLFNYKDMDVVVNDNSGLIIDFDPDGYSISLESINYLYYVKEHGSIDRLRAILDFGHIYTDIKVGHLLDVLSEYDHEFDNDDIAVSVLGDYNFYFLVDEDEYCIYFNCVMCTDCFSKQLEDCKEKYNIRAYEI